MTGTSPTPLPDLAREVAMYLGPDWKLLTDAHYLYVSTVLGPNGAKLSVRTDKDKAVVSGAYPSGPERLYDVKGYSINVAVSRGAATIAAEIKRRLLPDYLAELVRVQGEIAKDVARANRQREVADEVAAALPTFRRQHDGVSFTYDGNDVSLRLEVRVGGRIEVDRFYGGADYIIPAMVALMNVKTEGESA